MSDTTELAPVTPMALIERAAASGASIEQMQQLFELKLRVEADEAKKAFNEAFTAFKAERFAITRDKENTQYSKPGKPAMYTSLENMVATVTPFLSKHGLSARWDVTQTGVIVVACILSHTLGYSVMVSMSGAPDKSGSKNDLQQIKSTVTYLRVLTYEAVCGLATSFGNTDDDGNGSGTRKPANPMSDHLLADYICSIEAAEDESQLKAVFNTAFLRAQELADKGAQGQLIEARNKRKGKL